MAKMNRKVKIAVWIVVGVVVLAGLGVATLAVVARRAVGDYRGEAASQINTVIGGKTTGLPVELKKIWFGKLLSSDYKRVADLEPDYKELLDDVKNYVAALDVHNVLVGQYNAGLKGDKPLNGDLLKSINKYTAIIESRFPNEKDRVKALSELSNKVTSVTDFDAVSTDIDTVLQGGNDWLAKIRENLNTHIAEFQKKIN